MPLAEPFPRANGMAALVVWTLVLPMSAIPGHFVHEVEDTVGHWYFAATGMHIGKPSSDHPGFSDGDQKALGDLVTMGVIGPSDIELYIRLSMAFSPRNIFGVGTAWGFSTHVLSLVFRGASIDVIDAGIQGKDNMKGIELTRKVAAMFKRNISVTVGFSPEDTPRAIHSKGQPYELVVIDGLHTNAQIFKDFKGIYPYLAKRSVVIFHGAIGMQLGIYRTLCTFPEMHFAYYMSLTHGTGLFRYGTGFMWRGFPDDTFTGFHDLEIPYHCLGTKFPMVQMMPKLHMGEEDDGAPDALCLDGILKLPLCCAPECVQCGGPGCDQYPGSGDRCCGYGLREKPCTSEAGPPPCVYQQIYM